MPSDTVFSKLSENHKIIEIGWPEKLWLFKKVQRHERYVHVIKVLPEMVINLSLEMVQFNVFVIHGTNY